MGALEKRVRKGEIQWVILRAVAAAGILGTALVAPKALRLLNTKKVMGFLDPKRVSVARTSMWKLVKLGFLEFEMRDGKKFFRLTPNGKKRLEELNIRNALLKPPRSWDGKWRMVIFDIHEIRKNTRDQLRRELQSVGFKKLQASVWIFPFPCEDYINLLKADLTIGKDILYVIAAEIEHDALFRRHFKLEY